MEFLRAILNWVKRRRYISLFTLLIFVVGFLFVRTQLSRRNGYVSEPLKRGSIVQSVYGIGTVIANQSFQIKPAVTTTLEDAYCKEGDEVKKGARLLKIDETVFRAPFSGTITSLTSKRGENLPVNQPVLTLINLEDRYILVSLEQQGALRVARGQKAKLSFDTIRDSNFDGYVESVYPSETNFLARINISKLPQRILPGMTADVAIAIVKHENVLLLPVAALEEGQFVWVQSALPKKVQVEVGIVDRDYAEVLGGNLHEGEQVLISKKASP
ncbi:MAG: efflux RND transporter periplasmic adaptor subunit [Pseudobdellovibrio sp.]